MTRKLYVIFPVVIIVIAAVVITFALSATNNNDRYDNNMNPELPVNDSRQSVFTTGSPLLGSPNASIIMLEFGDYQCLMCERYFDNTEHNILRNYVESGKLKIIFMDFAFIGPDSILAAQSAHCAEDQGKYWQYHDELYSNWDGENTGWASKRNLKNFATNIGLDNNNFNECLDSGKYASKVENNMIIGKQLEVTGAPTFFIFKSSSDMEKIIGNVEKIVGAQPYSTFSNVLDSMLN